MYNTNLESTFKKAYLHAEMNDHSEVTLEHILLALLDNADAKDILQQCDIDIKQLKIDLCMFIESTAIKDKSCKPIKNQRVHEILSLATAEHQKKNTGNKLSGAELLVYVLDEADVETFSFMNKNRQCQYKDCSEQNAEYSENPDKSNKEDYLFQEQQIKSISPDIDEIPVQKMEVSHILEKYTINLNYKLRSGNLGKIIGREKEIQRCIQILSRKKNNNPLLIGEHGVGKSMMIEGLTTMINAGEVPKSLQGAKVYSLMMDSVIAGTKYRGELEKRMNSIINELISFKGSILFIDELQVLINFLSSPESAETANIIKSMLCLEEIRCIGSINFHDYQKHLSQDTSLIRRFQTVEIKEPDNATTLKMLMEIKGSYEEFYDVNYEPKILRHIIQQSEKYIKDKNFPEKAIDVIDESGAIYSLQRDLNPHSKLGISKNDVNHAIANLSKISLEKINHNQTHSIKNLNKTLKKYVFGQDKAIDILSDAVAISTSGLGNDEKPVASLLFTGPTGVGKTEIAKQLAKELGTTLLRFDMSEYMEKHSVARLIGSPPGYVGHEKGGKLIDDILRYPNAVLLFDEIEKAHSDLMNIFLQIMDYGKITDSLGRHADFCQSIIIMTSNIGCSVEHQSQIGFAHDEPITSNEDLELFFSPEFRNRLDGIITFNNLKMPIILRIVDKYLGILMQKLEKRGLRLDISKQAKFWLAKQGYDDKLGARPIERIINQWVKKPLANRILSDECPKDDTIHICIKQGQLAVI